ncbi:CIA30 family protein [Vibrio penaeicida]
MPVFRGSRVENAADFRFKDTKQFGFLLADKQAGKFHLEVSHFSFQ